MFTLALVLSALAPAAVRGQMSAEERLTRRDELLAADRSVADSTMRLGLAEGLFQAGAPDLVVLLAGAPIVAGRDAAHEMLAAQEVLRSFTLRWVPLYAEVSGDGSFAVSWGVTGIAPAAAPPDAPPLRFGKYLSAWRREAGGWKLVAHCQIGLTRPADYRLPAGFAPPSPSPLPRRGPLAALASADSGFAALAGRQGAAAAFAAYAADDAVTFAATGELNRGPAAIRRWLREDGPPSHWSWRPVLAGGSAAGDLGFTVGEAEITGAGPDGKPATFFSKYLTLWRRDAKGRVRFVADGGNARPAH
jgi:ketosteroid isomerase-like protein